jgi:pSer/pThr/pTyr-binding forkhead associated (FHA) protein
MKQRVWTIGSALDCDVRVESPTVSGRHCRLTQQGSSFVLEDLASTNGTFVAGQRVEGPREVRRDDPITLGLTTPMPWPNLISITVGRLPDNDVVVPLDVVSGCHARLEREGNRVFLIDLDSTNGTALNDPLNKIRRAAIQPSDVVFLGTHRIPARELLVALPDDPPQPAVAPQATMLESSLLFDLQPKAAADSPRRDLPTPSDSWLGSYRSARSWMLGIGLSAACLLVAMVASWAFRGGMKNDGSTTEEPGSQSQGAADAGNIAAAPERQPKEQPRLPKPSPPQRLPEPAFDEQLVRSSENGIYMLCIRSGPVVSFMRSTAWAISPDTIVCPTDVLKHFESLLIKGDKLDDCIVVCSPTQTLRIMNHSPAEGEGAFLSMGHIEARVQAVDFRLEAATSFAPEPGQKLAVLVAAGASSAPGRPNDDPATISRRLVSLKIGRIQRDAGQMPLAWFCTASDDLGQATAAPVFNGAGQVVGCVESASKTAVRVVPISRLQSLCRITP